AALRRRQPGRGARSGPRHRVPALFALPSPERAGERDARAHAAGRLSRAATAPRRVSRGGDALPGAHRARRARRQVSARALRRDAAARRDRAGAHQAAQDPDDGRAVRRARPGDARAHAGVAARAVGSRAHDDLLRHARHGGSDLSRHARRRALAALHRRSRQWRDGAQGRARGRRLRAAERGQFHQGQAQRGIRVARRGDPPLRLRPRSAAPRHRVQPPPPGLVPDAQPRGSARRARHCMSDQRDLESLLASRFPLVAIETNEEVRARELLARIARGKNWPLMSWSVSEGLESANLAGGVTAQTNEPTAALRQIQQAGPAGVYVLLDFHPYLDQPVNARLLKEIALDHEKIARTLVLVGLEVKLPPDLDKLAVRFRLSLPGADDLKTIIREEVKAWQASRGGQEVKGERSAFDQLIRHLSGLTESDVRRLVRQALEDGLLDASDVERLIARKHEMLGRDSVLTFEIDTARFSEVAGLATLKHWLERRREAFLGDAAALGVDVPKGIMLLGVQGCGKSLAAKALA